MYKLFPPLKTSRYLPKQITSSLKIYPRIHIKMNSTTADYNPSAGNAPKQTSQIQNLTLNDGNSIPMLGYGLGTARARIGNTDSTNIDKSLVSTVVTAIKTGYHHLDGAEVYGNEAELGAAIAASGVPRSSLYVVTKYFGKAEPDIQKAFEESLKRLQLDYVDLYLIHSPYIGDGSAKTLQAKWADVEAIQASGRAKSIGVSNFFQGHLESILETAKVVPAINQIEFHPYLQHGNLVPFCHEKGIAVSAYAPLTAVTKAKGGELDGVYEALARKYGVTPGEIALRWCIDQGVVALTTSEKEDRMKSYLRVSAFKLTPKEVDEIKQLGAKRHFRGFWQDKFAADDRS